MNHLTRSRMLCQELCLYQPQISDITPSPILRDPDISPISAASHSVDQAPLVHSRHSRQPPLYSLRRSGWVNAIEQACSTFAIPVRRMPMRVPASSMLYTLYSLRAFLEYARQILHNGIRSESPSSLACGDPHQITAKILLR